MKRKKINFLSELYERSYVSKHYSNIRLSFNTNYLYKSNSSNPPEIEDVFVDTIIAFPKFLKPEFHNTNKITVKRINQYGLDGYGMKIEPKFLNVESYLKASFSHSFRSNIKRLNKRLDTCFSISYKMYFGHIEKSNYDFLIDSLFKMQVKRLNQKNIINNLISEYDNYKKIVFDLINSNKASFFVIYNKNEPIGITLNFHLNSTFFGKVIAFDANYSKFGIGNTLIYKQLEWCIENKYEFLDMGNGAFDYKRRWCNYHYDLETHIILSKRSLKANGIAAFLYLFIKLKNVIKKNKIDELYINLRNKNNSKTENNISDLQYSFKDLGLIPLSENSIKIDIEDLIYNELKKPVFDFLYTSQDHFDDISIYKEKENTYVFKGKKKSVQCVMQSLVSH